MQDGVFPPARSLNAEASPDRKRHLNGGGGTESGEAHESFESGSSRSEAEAPEKKGVQNQSDEPEKEPAHLPGKLDAPSILSMRLPASAMEGVETKLVRTKIVVGRPAKDQFFRVKEGEDCWVPFGILEWQRTSSTYLVAPGAVRDWMLEEEINSYFDCILCLTVTRHGEPRIWPLKCTENDWHLSARAIAERAKREWLKLIPNHDSGSYSAGLAKEQEKDPTWPEESFGQLLEKAFSGRILDSLEHEVIRELSGDE